MLLVWSNPCRGSWVQPDVLYIYLLVSMCWNDKMYIWGGSRWVCGKKFPVALTGQACVQAVSLVHSFCSATPFPLSEDSRPLFRTYARGVGVCVCVELVVAALACWSEVTLWQKLVNVEMEGGGVLSASPTGHRCKGRCPLWLSPWQLPRQRQAPVVTFAKVTRLDRSEGFLRSGTRH